MLTKPKTSGTGTVVRFKRRQVRRNPRRPLEAVEQDWATWDQVAEAMGINWSEFARRAQNALVDQWRSATVSEKGAQKNGAPARAKPAAKRAARKG